MNLDRWVLHPERYPGPLVTSQTPLCWLGMHSGLVLRLYDICFVLQTKAFWFSLSLSLIYVFGLLKSGKEPNIGVYIIISHFEKFKIIDGV